MKLASMEKVVWYNKYSPLREKFGLFLAELGNYETVRKYRIVRMFITCKYKCAANRAEIH